MATTKIPAQLPSARAGSDSPTSSEVAKPEPHADDEPLTHLQRELFGIGRALCGAPAVTTSGRVHVPVDVAFADPAALQNRRLCAHCVTRFHRIRNM
jgi:hypothetical protein